MHKQKFDAAHDEKLFLIAVHQLHLKRSDNRGKRQGDSRNNLLFI
jgi:hypothetical protein